MKAFSLFVIVLFMSCLNSPQAQSSQKADSDSANVTEEVRETEVDSDTTQSSATGYVELDSTNFHEIVTEGEGISMVDFYSPRCPACNAMTSIIDSIAREFGDDVLIGKLNTDNDNTIWRQHLIQTLPTFVFFKDGEEYHRIEGRDTKEKLIEGIEMGLNNSEK
ncbi:thioredoxin family protein [Chitinispirillales bacterium ANBcel5]|uniref:thioredoxin family protein n=1 Tax=Cellulosispirillum alkaliphilum TaxID=3039283 RepID=UPI002A5943A2|nr:thioredoxin family protein [Chitinispirillales bacterium ANBcel5]